MNDFTKEELETIYLDMSHSILKYGEENIAPFYFQLRDKVESMINRIDDCEHANTVTGAYPRSNPPKKCDACGALYYE